MTAAVKRGVAYLRNEKIYLHPYAKTIKGLWTACEPILVTSENDESLGKTILRTLANSTENIPHPELQARGDASSAMRALVRAAGVRSYEAFADSTQCVGIKLDVTEVEFTPTLNGGYRRRFLDLETTIRCRPVEAEIAAALISAFQACET
jgi:hypothetical protein